MNIIDWNWTEYNDLIGQSRSSFIPELNFIIIKWKMYKSPIKSKITF